ncbi:glycosyltransferase family 2 protein [Parvularcula maris]|uniref:Glycosyltransferase n=1 Tax=Parvularcula maris TaxID=2965077 RepID=A0A9X2RJ58_9PROT|nr:glycosyltransferase [Parvularcula maris]MCQ8184338.1 glycosyltransferase [Parvularcula maris]
MEQGSNTLGVVVIGRNEGERLRACLRSLPSGCPVVYVDSGSSDGSVELARGEGAAAVELTTDKPFSAARGRNEGFAYFREHHPELTFVQFIDGDCVLLDGWVESGLAALGSNPKLAAVAGLRKERHPEASWYNELCAIEWNTPVGRANAVGGDAIYRVSAFEEVGGFDPMMMAGEEPELCLRLRRQGHEIERLDADMTLHDADIHSFSAWWKRAVRSGYAYTLGALKHGREGYRVKEVIRSLVWGAGLPLLALAALLMGLWPLTLIVLALYGAKWLRLRRRFKTAGLPATRLASYLMLANIAEVRGIAQALTEGRSGRRIIEYKGTQS